MTKHRIETLCFGESDVIKLIKALDVSKGHGHDTISVKMIKICADSIAHPLTLIFQSSLFQRLGKTYHCSNSYKNDKQIVPNYRPVSLLPICSKIFEKLIFNELFAFFEKRNLLTKHQSGFRPGDSCIYWML